MHDIKRQFFREALVVFFITFFSFGFSICDSDLRSYILQHAGAEAVGELGSFQLNLPRSSLHPTGDIINIDGRQVAAKQPGLSFFAGIVYHFVNYLGITYRQNFILAGFLTSLLTNCLIMAVCSSVLYLKYRVLDGIKTTDAVLSVFVFSFCTIAFPYTGVLHHDALAISLLVLAYLLFEFSEKPKTNLRVSNFFVVLSGICIGFVFFVSMLPNWFSLALILLVLYRKEPREGIFFVLAILSGLGPLFLYNLHFFGNPLLQANFAGGFQDTYGWDFRNVLHHLNIYFGSGEITLLKYSPVTFFGVLGWILSTRNNVSVSIFFLVASILHIVYLLGIPAFGYCQFGPRFMIPYCAFSVIGLPHLFRGVQRIKSILGVFLTNIVLAIVISYSFLVNLIGANAGTMRCDVEKFVPLSILVQSVSELHAMKMVFLMAFASFGCFIFLNYNGRNPRI